mgnify:CR=1 FL=1
MNLLIKQARIVDPSSPSNGQTLDIFIEDGIIKKTGKNLLLEADKTIDIKGLHVSPGWMDVFAHFGDPGYEFKETLETGANAALMKGLEAYDRRHCWRGAWGHLVTLTGWEAVAKKQPRPPQHPE